MSIEPQLTQTQTIERLYLMLDCQGMPPYEADIINRAVEAGVPYIEVREVAAIFWAKLGNHWGAA